MNRTSDLPVSRDSSIVRNRGPLVRLLPGFAEQRLEAGPVREVRRLDGVARAHVVEGRPDTLQRRAGELGPGHAVERQLQLGGVLLTVGLPVHQEVATLRSR